MQGCVGLYPLSGTSTVAAAEVSNVARLTVGASWLDQAVGPSFALRLFRFAVQPRYSHWL